MPLRQVSVTVIQTNTISVMSYSYVYKFAGGGPLASSYTSQGTVATGNHKLAFFFFFYYRLEHVCIIASFRKIYNVCKPVHSQHMGM